jgi:dipeptidase
MRRVIILLLVLAAGMPQAFTCTSIMVGKEASTDGSVMTSHTCDSHRTSSAIVIVPHKNNGKGDELLLTKRSEDDSGPMERYGRVPTGRIPQVKETYGYLAPAYAAMNEYQVAIGESTFGGREELKSEAGLIDCETLTRLMLERTTTAREAIRVGGELIERYGWNDEGEALTITDPEEVWLMEIVGPGKDVVGAVWAAQRIPDDHVSVIANAARIGQIDLDDENYFMASANVFDVAKGLGFWDPESGAPFSFFEVYNPDGRHSFASTRREWRVLAQLAPALELHANSHVDPLSV